MKYTGNYNLKKPEGTDTVDIEDLNENADKIDEELKNHVDNKIQHVSTQERVYWNNKWKYDEETIKNVKVYNAYHADTVNDLYLVDTEEENIGVIGLVFASGDTSPVLVDDKDDYVLISSITVPDRKFVSFVSLKGFFSSKTAGTDYSEDEKITVDTVCVWEQPSHTTEFDLTVEATSGSVIEFWAKRTGQQSREKYIAKRDFRTNYYNKLMHLD